MPPPATRATPSPDPFPAADRAAGRCRRVGGVVGRESADGVGQVGFGRGEPPDQQSDAEADQAAGGQRVAVRWSWPTPASARAAAPMNRGSGFPATIRRIHTNIAM